jgi:capsular exopolysaccharide synthesis family protein
MPNPHELLDKICRIHEDGATGFLHLEKSGQDVKVYFNGGLISAASSNIASLQLGRFLLARGHIDDAGLDRLLKKSRRRHIPLGKAAVFQKLLDETGMEQVVREQVVHALLHALANDFEIRAFEQSSSDFFAPARLDVSLLFLELARNHISPMKLEATQRIALTNGRDFAGLPWYPQELSVLGELQHPRTLQELAAATGLEYARLSKILSVFNSLHLISLEEDFSSETMAIAKREDFPFERLTPVISGKGLSEKLETLRDESSFVSEQFKTLKIRIGQASSNRALRVIAISSPEAKDGKSLISANLAISCSKDPGRRVIIIDCDMRNPTLHRLMGISPEPGLLGYLEGDCLQPYCYMRRHEQLYIMTAGGIADNPVELLSLDKMRKLIGYLKATFDTIILDSPPFAPISDAQILTSLADGLILVVRSGKTTYSSIEKAFLSLDPQKLVGVVFNDVKPMLFGTHYDYKYYHYKYRSHYPYGTPHVHIRPKTYLEK